MCYFLLQVFYEHTTLQNYHKESDARLFCVQKSFFLLFQPWKASYPWPAYIYRIVNVCLLDFISSLFLLVECLKHFTLILAIHVWTQHYYFQTKTIHQKSRLTKIFIYQKINDLFGLHQTALALDLVDRVRL